MDQHRGIPEHVGPILGSAVDTREQLDVLLCLRRARPKSVAARTVAAVCHLAPVTAEQHLAVLCGRGFSTVSIGNDLVYKYQPMSPEIEAVLAELESRVQ